MPDSFSTEGLPPPDRYQNFIHAVELRGVRLVSCNVKSDAVLNESMPASYELDVESTFAWIEQGFEAVQECTVSVFVQEEEGAVPVGSINVAYGFVYSCTFEDEEYDRDAYLQIFQRVSLPVNAWPFIRQFVHDMTQRMNWPALTLPLLKPAEEATGPEVPESE